MTLDSRNVHGLFTGTEGVKVGDNNRDLISEVEISEAQAGKPKIAQQFGGESELREPIKNAQSSTSTSIVNEWLTLQKRMIEALTPKPLDAIELGGNFDAPFKMGDSENTDPIDIANLFDLSATAVCDLGLVADLDKTIRYNAVWRIICSEETRPELVLPVKLRQLSLPDD